MHLQLRLPLGPLSGPLGRDLRAGALRQASGVVTTPPWPADEADRVVTHADLAPLPEPARRYLTFMGVVGRPRDWSFLVRFRGRFRLNGQAWMPADAWQYNARTPITRVFHMRLDFARVIPMVGRDTYLNGRGAMRGKLLDLVTVADGSGPEFDLGELVTYLNDAIALAPSMLLDDAVEWSAHDDDAFSVTLVDAGRSVSAVVEIGPDGAPTNFYTDDRWCDLPGGLVRARWSTPFPGWTVADGRPWPEPGSAVWSLPDGPLTYVEGGFVADTVVRNTPPGALLR